MNLDQNACCICKSRQHTRGGDAPWRIRCLDVVACNDRCVAGAWAEQLHRALLTKGDSR